MIKWIFCFLSIFLIHTSFPQTKAVAQPDAPDQKNVFRLLMGQFPKEKMAIQLKNSIEAMGYHSYVIKIQDRDHISWYQVQTGDYTSTTEAREQRAYLSNKLGIGESIPVISVPLSVKKKKQAESY